MNSNRFRAYVLLLVISLFLFTGCASKENTLDYAKHPPELATYYEQLGWHSQSVLDALDLKEADLEVIDEDTGYYKTSKAATFHGIPFQIHLTIPTAPKGNYNSLYRVDYFWQVDGDSRTQAEQILQLAQALSKDLGLPADDFQNNPSIVHIAEMSIEELAAWLSNGSRGSHGNYWSFGQVKTTETLAYRAFLQGIHYGMESSPLCSDYPDLELQLAVFKDGTGTVQVYLQYGLNYFRSVP